jgi:hypothetical protein
MVAPIWANGIDVVKSARKVEIAPATNVDAPEMKAVAMKDEIVPSVISRETEANILTTNGTVDGTRIDG